MFLYVSLKNNLLIGQTIFLYYSNGDCVSFKDNQAYNNCNGRQSCAFFDFGTSLPECENKQSSYLQVEYECIPSKK